MAWARDTTSHRWVAAQGRRGLLGQEAAFFAAVEKTTGFEINDEQLALTDLGNNTMVTLAPK